MTRTRLLAIRAVAFLISFLSMVFIATNTGDRFDTVLLNGRLVGEAADTANAFAIGIFSGAIGVICTILLQRQS